MGKHLSFLTSLKDTDQIIFKKYKGVPPIDWEDYDLYFLEVCRRVRLFMQKILITLVVILIGFNSPNIGTLFTSSVCFTCNYSYSYSQYKLFGTCYQLLVSQRHKEECLMCIEDKEYLQKGLVLQYQLHNKVETLPTFRPDALVFFRTFIFALKKTRASGRNISKVINPEPAEKPSLQRILSSSTYLIGI